MANPTIAKEKGTDSRKTNVFPVRSPPHIIEIPIIAKAKPKSRYPFCEGSVGLEGGLAFLDNSV